MTDSSATLKKIINNVEKLIIGKRESIELAMIALICEGHVLIEDIPGVGKTSMVAAISKSISCSFKRIQFTPDILPSDITGFSMFNQKTSDFEFRPGSIMSNIILADEINRTTPKTQASLLEVMDEKQVTVDGTTYKLPAPFMVLATQNPVEYLGTYPLPEAQLDRFFMKISLGYPTPEEESMMLERFKHGSPLEQLTAVVESSEVAAISQEVRKIHVDRTLHDYIVDICAQTRRHEDVVLGASPRGSLCLYRAAQAHALYQGRNYVLPDDIKKLAVPVLNHRLILRQEAKIRKVLPSEIISSIVSKTKIPMVNAYDKK